MKRFQVALLVFIALVGSYGSSNVSARPESLDKVAQRMAKSLLAADWKAFRKDASPTIVIEERWTAYTSYFDKSAGNIRGDEGALGPSDFKAVSYFSMMANLPKLNAQHRKTFLGFCRVVQGSRKDYGGPMGTWPWVKGNGVVAGLDHGRVVGPVAKGIVVSNEDWCVEFEKNTGVWKARRLILGGH